MKVAPVNARLEQAIEEVVAGSSQRLDDLIEAGGVGPLAIKYVPSAWAKHYSVKGMPLKISETAGFTWGTATYVTPLAFPISSAIFGRIGVVAEYDPDGWRVFDATQQRAQELYLTWVRTQPDYGRLVLTMHSQLANQYLRNSFRERFRIDCVLFPPDQRNLAYTDVDDVWMAVTDWRRTGCIETSMSGRLQEAWFTVLVEEEFMPDTHDVTRSSLIGPIAPRQSNPSMASQIATAYRGASGFIRLVA